jgi:hypothetical protein
MRPSSAARQRHRVVPIAIAACIYFSALFVGCKSPNSHTSNPRLRQIDEIVAEHLPPGTPMARANLFLNSRGYHQEDATEPHSLVAIIEHIDPKTLQPSAARVTFRFDNNDKLVTYDLAAVQPTLLH